MAIYSEFSHEKVIFHSFFVCLRGYIRHKPNTEPMFHKKCGQVRGHQLIGKIGWWTGWLVHCNWVSHWKPQRNPCNMQKFGDDFPYNVAPPSYVCWFRFAPVTIVISTIKHIVIGVVCTNLAFERGPHIVAIIELANSNGHGSMFHPLGCALWRFPKSSESWTTMT